MNLCTFQKEQTNKQQQQVEEEEEAESELRYYDDDQDDDVADVLEMMMLMACCSCWKTAKMKHCRNGKTVRGELLLVSVCFCCCRELNNKLPEQN